MEEKYLNFILEKYYFNISIILLVKQETTRLILLLPNFPVFLFKYQTLKSSKFFSSGTCEIVGKLSEPRRHHSAVIIGMINDKYKNNASEISRQL